MIRGQEIMAVLLDTLYRDVGLFRIYEDSTQIQQIVIARNMISNAQG